MSDLLLQLGTYPLALTEALTDIMRPAGETESR